MEIANYHEENTTVLVGLGKRPSVYAQHKVKVETIFPRLKGSHMLYL